MALFGLIGGAKPKATGKSLPIMRELAVPVARVELSPRPSSDELLQRLFAAIVDGDQSQLDVLCRAHYLLIVEYTPIWAMIPNSLQSNSAAGAWYSRGLELITHHAAQIDGSPVA